MHTTTSHNSHIHYRRLLIHLLMVVAIIIGILIRFKGLGKWPLAIDEYYIAKSINNILTYGLPKFECGGYYFRGILYQYIVAPLLMFSNNNDEYYLRLIPVLFNILSIPPLYKLSKKISGDLVACATIILFSLSLWEIEFARFARMYSPFQMIFIWYVYFLYKAVVENSYKSEKALVLVSFISIFMHESSIFLLCLNFLSTIYKKQFKLSSLFVVKIVLFIFGYIYLTANFRRLGVIDFLPKDIVIHAPGGQVLLPILLFQDIHSFYSIFFLVTLAVLSAWLIKNIYYSSLDLHTKLFLPVILVCSLLNLFGISLVFFIIYLLIPGERTNKSKINFNIFRNFYAITIFIFIFWLSFGVMSNAWWYHFEGLSQFSVKKYLVVLFKFPNVIDSILYPWIKSVPILSILITITVFPTIIISIFSKKEENTGFRLISVILLLIFTMIGIINTQYSFTRYTFFIYPLLIILFTHSMYSVITYGVKIEKYKLYIFIILISCFMYFSEDYGVSHMINIDSIDYNFRRNFSDDLAGHYYHRSDARSVAEFVNKNKTDNDIVISTLHTPEYYLNKLDYYYGDYHSGEFTALIACSGTKNIWTNTLMIYKEEELWNIINKHGRGVYIITNSEKYPYRSDVTKEINNEFHKFEVFTDYSGIISVYYLSANRD